MAAALPDPLLHPIVFQTPRRLSRVTSWQEHTPFAMYLVDLLRPRTIVELGTHYGDSYCAFCQAVAELQVPATANAIDTWKGDSQTGTYGDEVILDLQAHHDPLYGSFSHLIQATFDEALPRFRDGSIDLLHIDGCHLYDAVRHDFDMWLPKVSRRGVVLLHDTERQLDEFGVWRLLAELRERFPTLEFSHGNGLALVLTGDEPAPELVALAQAEGDALAGLRALFASLGSRVRCIGQLQRNDADQAHLRALLEQAANANAELQRQVEQFDGRVAGIDERLAGLDERDARLEARLGDIDRRLAASDERVEALYQSRLLRAGRRLRPG
jgi:O-antigen biosynthesis protein